MELQKIYFLALKAFGDNLITLSLLKDIPDVEIIGTYHTVNIAKLIGYNQKIHPLFEDIPAFYDIKKQGLWAAIKDLFYLRKYLRQNNIEKIFFETKDWRVMVITCCMDIQAFYPSSNKDIYLSRMDLIQNICNSKISLVTQYPPINKARSILINPTTREDYRDIDAKYLIDIINILGLNYHITLVDYSNKYGDFIDKVDNYVINTTLLDVKELMQKSDFYIGGDSFLVHLAYYLNKPYFVVFNRDNDNFLPPNATKNCYLKTNRVNDFKATIKRKFLILGLK